jgi:hypothetical protein
MIYYDSGENIWGPSNWYHKLLGVMPPEADRIVETDHLPKAMVAALESVTTAIGPDQDTLAVEKLDKPSGPGGDFYRVTYSNPTARDRVIRLLDAAIPDVLSDPGLKDPQTEAKIKKAITSKAQ